MSECEIADCEEPAEYSIKEYGMNVCEFHLDSYLGNLYEAIEE